MLKTVSLPSYLVLLSVSLLTPGCVETRQLPAELPAVGSTTSMLVGPAGAELSIGDLQVVVPPGAVASDTMITIVVDEANVPFTAYSPLIRLLPSTLQLAHPVEVRVPFRGDPALAAAFVAGVGDGGFAARTTTIEGDVASLQMRALSSTFVGTACEGPECRCEPIGTLDLLLVVDNSNSMVEEQALLRAQLPILFEALATGDLDHDGIQDVAAFDDVRVGITTPDLGAGPITGIPTCDPGFGDNGMLLDQPGSAADASCTTPTYPTAYASYDAATPAGIGGFVAQIACTSSLGNGGCGFEQQLEAALLALTPNAPTAFTAPGWTVPTFPEGRVGQADMANAGFLRDGSVLAVLYVTDEDDCSTTDSGLFSRDDPRFAGTNLNLRCFMHPEMTIESDEMGLALAALRPRPEDVIVGAITGVPMTAETADLGSVLAAPEMEERVDLANPNTLVPACMSPNGIAFPARRIVSSMRAVETAGGHAVLGSICSPSFASFTSRLATALAERAGGSC